MHKFYLTTAIDYVNDKPHLGHALEKIQADALARYARLVYSPDNVFFLTGTDEHGVKIARAAEAAGKEPQKFADEVSEKFKALKEELNLSWNAFIRTSDSERHLPGVKKLWAAIEASGDIYKKAYRGLYCVGHEAFVTEKDLANGKCRDHQKEPETIEEENYFFRLSNYTKPIEQKIRSGEFQILPDSRKNEILSLLSEGLEDVSFSRPRKDLKCGFEVPGDPNQTIYVWADALTNYVSAIGYGRGEDYKNWWDNAERAHLIGKDILRFHSAIWPAMLMSAGMPLPNKLFVHGFITVNGQKMSKTVGNVVDPILIAQKYGRDVLRYYLLKEVPSGEDGDFSEEKLVALYNGDLANGLGNFAARVTALAEGMELSPELPSYGEENEVLSRAEKAISKKMDTFRIHEAVMALWELIRFGDAYLNEKAPWKKEDALVIAALLKILKKVIFYLRVFMPETADKIEKCFYSEGGKVKVKKVGILFPRLK